MNPSQETSSNGLTGDVAPQLALGPTKEDFTGVRNRVSEKVAAASSGPSRPSSEEDLAEVVKAWPALPDAVKGRILGLVEGVRMT